VSPGEQNSSSVDYYTVRTMSRNDTQVLKLQPVVGGDTVVEVELEPEEVYTVNVEATNCVGSTWHSADIVTPSKTFCGNCIQKYQKVAARHLLNSAHFDRSI